MQTFSRPTRTAHKRVSGAKPSYESPRPAFVGLALEGSDIQQFALSKSLGRTVILFNQRRNFNFKFPPWLFVVNERFGQICTQTLSLPKNLNAGKPLSVRGLKTESPER